MTARARLCAAALAVALALAHAATARPARAAEPDAALVEAKRRYEALEYEKCLALLARAERSASAASERVEVALYDGLCSFELGHRERAEADFRAALRLDAGATLPPYTSPKIVEVFDAVAAQLRAERRAAPAAPASPAASSATSAPAAPAAPRAPPPAAERRAASHAPPLASILLGGCAVVAAGTGAYFAVHANDLAGDANAARFESDAYALGDRARLTMTGANVAFGVAAVTAAAAIVYWIVAR